jgi:hypothetical protein
MFVVIVNDPEKGLQEDNLKVHMGDGPCQHLLGDKPGEHSCRIHGYPWYGETPCAAHGQIEVRDSPCRMGKYLLEQLNGKDSQKLGPV